MRLFKDEKKESKKIIIMIYSPIITILIFSSIFLGELFFYGWYVFYPIQSIALFIVPAQLDHCFAAGRFIFQAG